MNKPCAFTERCEIPETVGVRLFCQEVWGESCGSAWAEEMTYRLDAAGELEKLDQELPIVGFAVLDSLPDGDMPEYLRNGLIGTRFELREGYDAEDGKLIIHPTDFALGLIEFGKFEQKTLLDMYHKGVLDAGRDLQPWRFNTEECRVSSYATPKTTSGVMLERLYRKNLGRTAMPILAAVVAAKKSGRTPIEELQGYTTTI